MGGAASRGHLLKCIPKADCRLQTPKAVGLSGSVQGQGSEWLSGLLGEAKSAAQHLEPIHPPTHSLAYSPSNLVCALQLRRAYLGAGYGDSSGSSSDDYEDRDYVVPRGRLLEDYQRLALHTERHLNGEALRGGKGRL